MVRKMRNVVRSDAVTLQQEILNLTVRYCEYLGEDFVAGEIVCDELKTSFGEVTSEQIVRATYHLSKNEKIQRCGLGKWKSSLNHKARGNKLCKALEERDRRWYCPVKKEFVVNSNYNCGSAFITVDCRQVLKPVCSFFQ